MAIARATSRASDSFGDLALDVISSISPRSPVAQGREDVKPCDLSQVRARALAGVNGGLLAVADGPQRQLFDLSI